MRTRLITFLFCISIASGAFANAFITIQAGAGFDDPTPATPVGGNSGTTVGQQRLNSFARAAAIWGNLIDSPVEIVIAASFANLSCTSTTGVLGSAGATEAFVNFENAPRQDVWYPPSLANKYAGRDLSPMTADIRATFNRRLGQSGCLESTGWYYGFDGNHGEQTDLVVVLLHEFAHGLGFQAFSDNETGELLRGEDGRGRPNAFEIHMLDGLTGLRWDQLTDIQRISAATNDQGLLWDGAETVRAAAKYLGPAPVLRVNSPSVRTYAAGTASFGPSVTLAGLTGSVVAVEDVAEPQDGSTAAGSTRDGCSALLNASGVLGRIALVDRGGCTFVQKVRNARTAGAIGVIIVNNVSGAAPPQMGGTDAALDIPVISLTQSDGEAVRAELPSGLNATIGLDTTTRAGTNTSGFVKLYAPTELSLGSSVSHWDDTTNPNTLMERAISDDLDPNGVDITLEQMLDLGWTKNIPSGRRSLRRGSN